MKIRQRWLASGLFMVALCNGLVAAQAVATSSPPSTYYLLVFSNPVVGKEAEFERWYAEQHAPDVTSVPGFVSAQRFQLAPRQLRAGSPDLPKHVVRYKIVTGDLAAVYAEVNRRLMAGDTGMSDAVDGKSFVNRTYQAIRPELAGNRKLSGAAAAKPKLQYAQFVFGEATAGQEQAFNDWYDQHHATEVLAVPGFVWGQRLQWSDVQLNNGASGSKYLMMFRMETGNLDATLDAFGTAAPKMGMSTAFDGSRTFGYTYQAIGPELNGDKIRLARSRKAGGTKVPAPTPRS